MEGMGESLQGDAKTQVRMKKGVMARMGVAPPTPTKNVITFNKLSSPHTSPSNFSLFPSQSPLSSHTIVMRSLLLRHTRSIPSIITPLLAMSNCCSAVSAASNSSAVATVDSESSSTSSTPSAPPPKSKPRLRGVVFDMDGTLTVPVIDFQAMYKAVLGDELYADVRAKNPSGIDILSLIDGWSADRKYKAYQVIAKFEKNGIDRLRIMPGAPELCRFLDSKKIRRGLITRNVKEAVDIFHKHFESTFSPALSREFRPYKPDPAPLLHICSVWEIDPREVIMVGDSLKDDVACGKRAGAYTCLLDETGRYDSPEYASVEHKPDFRVSSLDQALSLLESHFELAPSK